MVEQDGNYSFSRKSIITQETTPCYKYKTTITNIHNIENPKSYMVAYIYFVAKHSWFCQGRTMAQAVSRRPLAAQTRVPFWVSLCEMCSGQSETGRGFFPSSSVFSCHFPPTVALHTHIPPG
jgi:hypothetical protein